MLFDLGRKYVAYQVLVSLALWNVDCLKTYNLVVSLLGNIWYMMLVPKGEGKLSMT